MKKFSIKEFNKLVQMSDIASISYLKETLIDNEKDFTRQYFLNHLYNSLVTLNNCIVIKDMCIIHLNYEYYYNIYIDLKKALFTELKLEYDIKKDNWKFIKGTKK